MMTHAPNALFTFVTSMALVHCSLGGGSQADGPAGSSEAAGRNVSGDENATTGPAEAAALAGPLGSHSVGGVTSDGSDYLVVYASVGELGDVYAARVSADGVVRDPLGIAIATGPSIQREPSVAWTGSHYLVVWNEIDLLEDVAVRAARVTSAGELLDPGGIDVASGAGIQRVRAVQSGGSVSLVVWTDGPSGGPFTVRARRIDASGSLLDAQPLLLGSTGADGVEVSAGHAGSHFLVAWENSSAIDAAIVGHDGDPGPTFTIQPGAADSPSVGADGSQFLVAWRDVTSGYKSANIVAARVTELGKVLDDGFVVSGAAASQSWPSVGSAAGSLVVTWEDSRHSDPEYPLDDKDIYAATISSAGGVGSEIRVSREHGQQLEPVIAAGADQTLIAWSDFRSGRLQVFATRLTSAGSVLDPDGFVVSRR